MKPVYTSPPCFMPEIEDTLLYWKCIQAPLEATDGYRVFIDRSLPHGVKKSDIAMDLWLKEIAPNPALNREFGCKSECRQAFRKHYYAELKKKQAVLKPILAKLHANTPVTFLTASKNHEYNAAIALVEYLQALL